MPRRKPTPQFKYQKARTHQLADGWTQVVRGPTPVQAGLSTPHAGAPATGLGLEELRTSCRRVSTATRNSEFRVEVERVLLEQVVGMFQDAGKDDGALEGRKESIRMSKQEEKSKGEEERRDERERTEGSEALKREAGSFHIPACGTARLARVVLLAIGSPTHHTPEIRRVAMVQLLAAEAWIELLIEHGALTKNSRRVAQDPGFNELDRKFLEEREWEVVQSPVAEDLICRHAESTQSDLTVSSTGGTVLLAPHLEETVLKNILERWRVGDGIMIGNDLGMVEDRMQFGRKASTDHITEDGQTQWWKGWHLIRPDAAGDSTSAREWFGVSLHWRREDVGVNKYIDAEPDVQVDVQGEPDTLTSRIGAMQIS